MYQSLGEEQVAGPTYPVRPTASGRSADAHPAAPDATVGHRTHGVSASDPPGRRRRRPRHLLQELRAMRSSRVFRLLALIFTALALAAASMPPAGAIVLAEQQDAGVWNFDGPGGSGIWGSARYTSPTLGDILFVGGKFTRAREFPLGTPGGGVLNGLSGLAAIDMATGAPIPAFAPIVTGVGSQKNEVHALAVVGTTLYVGGQFGAIDGQSHYNLAAIDIEAALDGNATTEAVISCLRHRGRRPGRVERGQVLRLRDPPERRRSLHRRCVQQGRRQRTSQGREAGPRRHPSERLEGRAGQRHDPRPGVLRRRVDDLRRGRVQLVPRRSRGSRSPA